MRTAPDAWASVRGHPGRFLTSSWPWRSLAYLVSTVPMGIVCLLVLALQVAIGLLTAVVVVGLVVLAGVPRVATAVAVLERRRAHLVQPGAAGGTETSLRERLRAARGVPVAWSE